MIFPSVKPWWRRLDGLALVLFAIGGAFLHGQNEQRFLGLLMVVALFLSNGFPGPSFLRRIAPIPPEVWCFTAWVFWAGTTGFVVAENTPVFMAGMMKIGQMLVVVWVAYAILCFSGSPWIVFLGIIVGGLLQIQSVLLSSGDMASLFNSATRQEGMVQNANSLGFYMIWTFLSLALFWPVAQKGHWLRKAAVLALIPATGLVMLASGSRKSFVVWSFVLAAWPIFGLVERRGEWFAQMLARGLITLAVVSAGWVAFPLAMEYTPVGKRFEILSDRGGGSTIAGMERDIRNEMYREGWTMFWSSPLVGVGWNQFRVKFWSGQYSHSDYMEPLATTGLVGFALYQSFYFILLRRIWRLLAASREAVDQYRLRIMLITIMAILMLGLGTPHFSSQIVFMILVSFSCYTWRRIRPEPSAPSSPLSAAPLFSPGWPAKSGNPVRPGGARTMRNGTT
jgi:O-antigen ligase